MNKPQWIEEGMVSGAQFCVCFLDFLGVKDELKSILDASDDDKALYGQAQKTAEIGGKVKLFRDLVEELVHDLIHRPSEIHEQLPVQLQERLSQLNQVDIRTCYFSDSIALTVRLSDPAPLPVLSVFSLLNIANSLVVATMLNGVPLRGGIDIGFGSPLSENEVYGQCLSRAYLLESETAGWPRIAVGDTMIEYLEGWVGKDPQSEEERFSVSFAGEALSLITEWKNVKMVEQITDLQRETLIPDNPEYLASLIDNIEVQLASAPDDKTRGRYRELIEFWNSRLPGVFIKHT